MIKSYSRILNEGFDSYFKKLEESVESVYDEYKHMTKDPIIEFPNGEYFYVVVDPESKTIYAGGATNTGVFREFEIELDEDDSLDGNLNRLYDYIIEERPELLDEEPMDESYSKKDLVDAVKDAYGFTTKEANNWIKNADETSKEEIVKGFKSNSTKSFLTDSLKESLGATDLVRDLYSKFKEVDFIDEKDLGENVGLIYDISKLKDKNKFKEYIKEYKVKSSKNNPNKIMIIAKEDGEYLGEAYDSNNTVSNCIDNYKYKDSAIIRIIGNNKYKVLVQDRFSDIKENPNNSKILNAKVIDSSDEYNKEFRKNILTIIVDEDTI